MLTSNIQATKITMKDCLIQICMDFETVGDFLKEPSAQKAYYIDELFFRFIKCFEVLKEEKLDYPKEFSKDVGLYLDGYEPIIIKFKDTHMRYLLLSDFYDYVRLTKKYKKEHS